MYIYIVHTYKPNSSPQPLCTVSRAPYRSNHSVPLAEYILSLMSVLGLVPSDILFCRIACNCFDSCSQAYHDHVKSMPLLLTASITACACCCLRCLRFLLQLLLGLF